MLRKLRERAQSEQGFTLIELLVVILIIGILAAIAIPSFINQRGKGNDAEAKSTAVTAAQAMETCATENNGQYVAGCTKARLQSIEPTLNDADSRLTVAPNGTDAYQIDVQSTRNAAVVYTIDRNADGTTDRTCVVGGQDEGGCNGGTW